MGVAIGDAWIEERRPIRRFDCSIHSPSVRVAVASFRFDRRAFRFAPQRRHGSLEDPLEEVAVVVVVGGVRGEGVRCVKPAASSFVRVRPICVSSRTKAGAKGSASSVAIYGLLRRPRTTAKVADIGEYALLVYGCQGNVRI